jgi:hypothetical protein
VFQQGWHYLAMPIAVALAGVFWVELALRQFERSEAHERQGIIGYHYSMPEWGFEYRPNGRAIETWAFSVPSVTTVLALGTSAVVGSRRRRTRRGRWGVVGLCVIHLFAALGFLGIAALVWVEAAAVFI